MEKNITCPSCDKTFLIKNNSQKEEVKIKCPFCQNEITIRFRQRPIQLDPAQAASFFNGQQSAAGEQHQQQYYQRYQPQQPQQPEQPKPKPKPQDSHATTLGGGPVLGAPVLIVNGITYKLNIGRNTVGRKAASSTATLQLPVFDQYMSRSNAVIEVSQTTAGEWHVTISSINERNLVKVGHNVIEMGDKVLLQAGYVITLGHTQIVFNFE